MPLVYAGVCSHAPGITGRAERADPEVPGGISHWPATPDSGRINEAWDRDFLDRWCAGDRERLCAYSDTDTYLDAGQGGFEIRTYVAAAAAGAGRGTVHFYAPIPIFAVGCTIADIEIG